MSFFKEKISSVEPSETNLGDSNEPCKLGKSYSFGLTANENIHTSLSDLAQNFGTSRIFSVANPVRPHESKRDSFGFDPDQGNWKSQSVFGLNNKEDFRKNMKKHRCEILVKKIEEDLEIIKKVCKNGYLKFDDGLNSARGKLWELKDNCMDLYRKGNRLYVRSEEVLKMFMQANMNSRSWQTTGPYNVLLVESALKISKRIEKISMVMEEDLECLLTIYKSNPVILVPTLKSSQIPSKRIENIQKNISELKKQLLITNDYLSSNRPEIYNLWDTQKFAYNDPENMKSLFKFQTKAHDKPKNQIQSEFDVLIESKRLEKTNLKIDLNIPLISCSLKGKRQGKVLGKNPLDSSMSKILALKEDLLLKIQKNNTEKSEPEIVKFAVPNNPVLNTFVKEEPKAKAEESVKIMQFNPQTIPNTMKPPENPNTNPFAGTGFGQPTTFATPSNLPNMSILANKSFGAPSGTFQGFSSFAPTNPPANLNPLPPTIAPQVVPGQNANSFFKLRK